jgi:hypothetical protein
MKDIDEKDLFSFFKNVKENDQQNILIAFTSKRVSLIVACLFLYYLFYDSHLIIGSLVGRDPPKDCL